MTRLTFCALLVIAAQWETPPARPLPPAPIVSHKITVLRDWVAAVNRHEPGESDAALLSIADWSTDDLQAAWVDAQALLALAKDSNANAFYLRPSGNRVVLRTLMSRQDLEAMRELAGRVKLDSLDRFVKRAAVLHSDVARNFRINADVMPGSSTWSPRRFVLQTDDGQPSGMGTGLVHWEFGEMALEHVANAGTDDFVRGWYRASLAYKLATEELDTQHFVRAIEIFPGDFVIRFLKGCLHDAFAHPSVQAVLDSARLPPRTRLDVRSEVAELRTAEAELRRATELDPSFAEARVRRGRVLARLGKHNEAATELRQALRLIREPMLEYFGRLFLGAEEEALGRFSEARSLYEQAARLYPNGQAPRLALSQLAHRGGNRVAARAALNAMLDGSTQIAFEDDPWWTYQRSAGRMADEWNAASYRALPR